MRTAVADRAAAAAAQAGFQVRRVGDETVRAQRLALLVAGDRLTAGTAARALLQAGVCDAHPADPRAGQRLVDAHHPPATGAGRPEDPGDPGGVQQIDEPGDRAQRREVAVSGQQPRVGFQLPGQFLLVGGSGRGPADRGGDRFPVSVRVQLGDQGVYYRYRVTAVCVRALPAPRSSSPVPGRDRPGVSADSAGRRPWPASCAVPVLPAAVEGP